MSDSTAWTLLKSSSTVFISALFAIVLGVLAACAAPAHAFAWLSDVSDSYPALQPIEVKGEVLTGEDVPEGLYSITAESSSYMCKFTSVQLTSVGGELYAEFTLSGAYDAIYFGTAEEAASQSAADGADYSPYYAVEPLGQRADNRRFAVPIPALNYEVTIATYSGGSKGTEAGMWYTRTVVFDSSSEVEKAVQEARNPDSMSGPGDFESSDGLVGVYGMTTGRVSYDAETRTLTLDGVQAERVGILQDTAITLDLIGANEADVVDRFSYWRESRDGDMVESGWMDADCKGSVMAFGDGSLAGKVDVKGDFTLDGEAIVSAAGGREVAVSCGKLTLKGGSISGYAACNEGATILGGSVSGVSCDDFVMSGGSVSGGVWCHGKLGITNGSVSGSIRCEEGGTMSGGKIAGGISCGSSFTLKGGSISKQLECDGAFTQSGGTVSIPDYTLACRSATVNGGSFTAKRGVDVAGNFTMKVGTVSGHVSCGGAFTQSGGTVVADKDFTSLRMPDCRNAIDEEFYFLDDGGTAHAADSAGMSQSGVITCKNIVINKGSFTAKGRIECSDGFTLKGGKVVGPISCKNLTMSGGAVSVSKYKGWDAAIDCSGALVVKGGKISLKTCDGTGIRCGSLVLSKGSILVDDQYDGTAVCIAGGNFSMTGGTMKVTCCWCDAVVVMCRETGGTTYRGVTKPLKRTGGVASIKGGSFTAKVRKPGSYDAMSAWKLSCKSSCVKAVKGQMPKGFAFKSGGSTYRVMQDNHEVFRDGYGEAGYATASSSSAGGSWAGYIGPYDHVCLVKFGGKGAKANFGTVKYGGRKYSVVGVAGKAFNTVQGAKLKTVTFSNTLESVDANAFYGAKSLTSLNICLPLAEKYDKKGSVKSVSVVKGYKLAKGAFKGCGKSGGAKLTVRLRVGWGYAESASSSGADAAYVAAQKKREAERWKPYKILLVSRGLSSKAAVGQWQ